MANIDEVSQTLLDNISDLTNKAGRAGSGGYAAQYAAAALQLAEAHAWLQNPSQGHGASSGSSS